VQAEASRIIASAAVNLEAGGDFADTEMVGYLPPRFLPKYNYLFAKQFLVCVATVGSKLTHPPHSMLACAGEELALNAIVDSAEAILDLRGEEAGLGDFLDGGVVGSQRTGAVAPHPPSDG
jgi:hypothetical protein